MQLRIRCTTQVWITAFGHTPAIACGSTPSNAGRLSGWLTVFQKRIEPTAHTCDAGSGRCPQVNPVQPPSFPCLAIVP
jgi:hypothetical protein